MRETEANATLAVAFFYGAEAVVATHAEYRGTTLFYPARVSILDLIAKYRCLVCLY